MRGRRPDLRGACSGVRPPGSCRGGPDRPIRPRRRTKNGSGPGSFHAAEPVRAGEPGAAESERRPTRTPRERCVPPASIGGGPAVPFAGGTRAFPGRATGIDGWPRVGRREMAPEPNGRTRPAPSPTGYTHRPSAGGGRTKHMPATFSSRPGRRAGTIEGRTPGLPLRTRVLPVQTLP